MQKTRTIDVIRITRQPGRKPDIKASTLKVGGPPKRIETVPVPGGMQSGSTTKRKGGK